MSNSAIFNVDQIYVQIVSTIFEEMGGYITFIWDLKNKITQRRSLKKSIHRRFVPEIASGKNQFQIEDH